MAFSLRRSTGYAVPLSPQPPRSRCPPPCAPSPRPGLADRGLSAVFAETVSCNSTLDTRWALAAQRVTPPGTSRRPKTVTAHTSGRKQGGAGARFCDAVPGVRSKGGKAGRRSVALPFRLSSGYWPTWPGLFLATRHGVGGTAGARGRGEDGGPGRPKMMVLRGRGRSWVRVTRRLVGDRPGGVGVGGRGPQPPGAPTRPAVKRSENGRCRRETASRPEAAEGLRYRAGSPHCWLGAECLKQLVSNVFWSGSLLDVLRVPLEGALVIA